MTPARLRVSVAVLLAVYAGGAVVASAAVVTTPAERGAAMQVARTLPPPPMPAGFDDARCPQWWPLALEVGWPPADMWHVDRILWGESRCQPDVLNDRGGDYSFGLMQINVKANIGTRPFVGPLVDWEWSRLYDPRTNLTVGLAFAEHWERHAWSNYCRWWGWTTRDRSVCG